MWSPSITPSQVLSHSAKGSTWKKHKYIKIVDGNYYYPNDYDQGRTISDLSKSELKDEDIDTIADETIRGKHGNGKDRREKFGSDYARIQNKVNEILGSNKRYEEEDDEEEETNEKSSGSSKRKKSSKSSSKKNHYILEKQRKASNKATMKAITEDQQKRKQRRIRRNILDGKSYLNHSSIWSPVASADYIYHSAIEGRK